MALTFGKLGVPTKSYYVQKTGFPFYDACQLVGAMHLFFGSGTSIISDKGSYWLLSGPGINREPQQISLSRHRIEGQLEHVGQSLKIFDKFPSDLEETSKFFQQKLLEKRFFKSREKIRRHLEPSLQSGARGADAANYNVLASEKSGNQVEAMHRPFPEVLAATVGLTYCAVASTGKKGGSYLVLPVFKNSIQSLTPFATYKRKHYHNAGESISAIYTALDILINFRQQYPITDFAYSHFGSRGFSKSGLLGLHTLCSQAEEGKKFLREARDYLRYTSSSDPGLPLDLARNLSHFLQNPVLETLTVIIGAKARLMSDEEQPKWITGAAEQLFSGDESIKEVLQMADSVSVPPPNEGVIEAVGEVFRAEGEGRWIGAYIQLERAHDPEKFYTEVSKILSRAMSRADGSDKRWLTSRLRKAMAKLSSEEVLMVYSPENKRYFTAHKTTFLLRVLGSMQYRAPAETETQQGDKE